MVPFAGLSRYEDIRGQVRTEKQREYQLGLRSQLENEQERPVTKLRNEDPFQKMCRDAREFGTLGVLW